MRFAVFLCYYVRYLYVFLRGLVVFVPPLRPPQSVFMISILVPFVCCKAVIATTFNIIVYVPYGCMGTIIQGIFQASC